MTDTKDDLLRLAERAEKASGPDRELDALITIAIDLRPDWCANYGPLWLDLDIGTSEPVIRVRTGAKRSRGNPPIGYYPVFTRSIDDAITLVPEEWRVANLGETVIEGNDPWNVRLLEKRFDGRARRAEGDAATAALAITAASLRARAAA